MRQNLFFNIFLLLMSNIFYAQSLIIDSIMSDGLMRKFTIYVPSSYTAASQTPLVISMHGMSSNMGQQVEISDFSALADVHRFIAVYPQSHTVTGVNAWNVDDNPDGTDDVAFIAQLIDTLSVRYNIDSERIYATGMSNGGYMSYKLACVMSNRIAAIASVTGTMTTAMYAACDATRAVPVMQIHGTTDPIVSYSGNANGINIDTVVKYWVAHNSCDNTPAYDSIPNINTGDNSFVHHFIYSGGKAGSSVELYKVYNGGHTWPGSSYFLPFAFIVGNTNLDMDASAQIWRFFD